jgi:hypothetical protein
MTTPMDNQTAFFPPDRPNSPRIRNLHELRAARKITKQRVVEGERQLKERLQELPGQLVYTGLKYVVPPLLSGKITNSLLSAGKYLVDLYFLKKDKSPDGKKGILSDTVRRAGLLAAVRWGMQLLTRAI